jgi:hypothetical protein
MNLCVNCSRRGYSCHFWKEKSGELVKLVAGDAGVLDAPRPMVCSLASTNRGQATGEPSAAPRHWHEWAFVDEVPAFT